MLTTNLQRLPSNQAVMSVSTLRIGPAGPLAGQASATCSDGSESAASILRSALLTHFGSTSSSSNDAIAIDTKYFTASVALADLDLAGAAAEGGDSKEDGVLLVFRDAVAGQAAPLDALASVHSAAEASNQAGDLLRLLVAVSMGPVPDKTTKAAEEEYSRRVLWCLDRGYEYVEADCSDLTAGHDEREKDGFARVVEAVGGTVWSCAVNKPREQRGAAAALAKIEAEMQEGEKKQEGGASDPDTSDNRGGADTGEAKAEPTAADAFPMPPEPKADEVAGDGGDKDGEDQFFFENLDSVMAQVRSISSQARSGALTDEERRMKASDAAVALMGMLENMGFDDESSSAGGEHSSQED